MIQFPTLPLTLHKAENAQSFQNQALILERNLREGEAQNQLRRAEERNHRVERGDDEEDTHIRRDGGGRNAAYFALRKGTDGQEEEDGEGEKTRNPGEGGLIDILA